MDKHIFSLSANIENGFTEASNYIVTPNAQKVLQEIMNGYHAGIHSFSIIGTYGTGKSSFLIQLEQDLRASVSPSLLKNPKVLHDGPFEFVNILGDYKPLEKLLRIRLQEQSGIHEDDTLKLLKNYCEQLKSKHKFLMIAIDEIGTCGKRKPRRGTLFHTENV